MALKDKNLLVIAHTYNSFVKDPVEKSAKDFNKVYVLVRYKPFSRILEKYPVKGFAKFRDSYVVDMKGKPDNVHVIRTPMWYLPYGLFNKKLGRIHFRAVEKAIKQNDIKFDLIHCHFVWSSGYVGMKLKEEYKAPLVITGHGYDIYKLPFTSESWKNQVEKILNSADVVTTVSEYNRDFVDKLDVDMSKVRVIGNGFSSELFYPQDKTKLRQKLCVDSDSKVCVSVGNLKEIKGQDILIKAIKVIVDKGEDVQCFIVGDGAQYKALKKLVSKLELQNNVFLLGVKPHYEVKDYIGMADIFVIPSRQESASVVLLEALACGVGVVGTRVGIVPEVLDNNLYGYIAEVENVEDLAEKISRGLRVAWDQDKISKYSEQYCWNSVVENFISVYEEVLK